MKSAVVHYDGEYLSARELRGIVKHLALMNGARRLARVLLKHHPKLQPIEWAVMLNQTAEILRASDEARQPRSLKIGTHTTTPSVLKV